MAIRINLSDYEQEAFFTYLYNHLPLVSASTICKPGKYFENGDSWKVADVMGECLLNTWKLMKRRHNLDNFFKFPVNSLTRKPFTVLYTGKTDYLDLTTFFAHWLGLSVDFDFKMFENDTGLGREALMKALSDNGLFQPFGNEYWHWSVTPDKIMERYGRQ